MALGSHPALQETQTGEHLPHNQPEKKKKTEKPRERERWKNKFEFGNPYHRPPAGRITCNSVTSKLQLAENYVSFNSINIRSFLLQDSPSRTQNSAFLCMCFTRAECLSSCFVMRVEGFLCMCFTRAECLSSCFVLPSGGWRASVFKQFLCIGITQIYFKRLLYFKEGVLTL